MTWFSRSIALWLVLFGSAVLLCDAGRHQCDSKRFQALNQDEHVCDIITRYVPVDVQLHLGWRRTSDILRALHRPRHLQWIEYFCGTGQLSLALSSVLPRGQSFDLVCGGVGHDILTTQGFAAMLDAALQLVPFALAWFAPPCSLWIFLSAGVHKRTVMRPSGDTSRPDVVANNRIVHRCCVLMRILTARLVQWVCEQPVTSLLFQFGSFLKLRTSAQMHILSSKLRRKFVWLGHWGGAIPKPTVLWGITPIFDVLFSVRPQTRRKASVNKTTKKTIIKNGRPCVVYRIYGVRKTLKNSQSYPKDFCIEFAGHLKRVYDKSLGMLAPA